MDLVERFPGFFDDISDEFYDESRYVSSSGPSGADVVLVGEAPGENEVEEGEPFVGRAGDRLDEVFDRIGIDRSDFYITNLVKVRPPENRDPTVDEISAWNPLLKKELEVVDPDVVITLGNFASRQLLDVNDGITSLRGSFYSVDGLRIFPVFHPAATLYDRSKMDVFEEDFRRVLGKSGSGQTKLSEI